MSADQVTSEHQFGEMHRKLAEGGFTYNPRTRKYVTSGFSVGTRRAAEYVQPLTGSRDEGSGEYIMLTGGAKPEHLEAYTKGSAPTWNAPGATAHIGGWRRKTYDPADVLDLPDVFPATPEGEVQARGATVEHDQEAYNALHRGFSDVYNPFNESSRDPFTPGGGARAYFAGDRRLWTKQPLIDRES